jgi:hypothetical protein
MTLHFCAALSKLVGGVEAQLLELVTLALDEGELSV